MAVFSIGFLLVLTQCLGKGGGEGCSAVTEPHTAVHVSIQASYFTARLDTPIQTVITSLCCRADTPQVMLFILSAYMTLLC